MTFDDLNDDLSDDLHDNLWQDVSNGAEAIANVNIVNTLDQMENNTFNDQEK